jgi:hypothetical protein
MGRAEMITHYRINYTIRPILLAQYIAVWARAHVLLSGT